eukprot:7196256-Pyramimonas_sp.AAC.1
MARGARRGARQSPGQEQAAGTAALVTGIVISALVSVVLCASRVLVMFVYDSNAIETQTHRNANIPPLKVCTIISYSSSSATTVDDRNSPCTYTICEVAYCAVTTPSRDAHANNAPAAR